MALLLALAIGGAGQTVPAQAASPDLVDISFELDVAPEKPPTIFLCPRNNKLTLYATVFKTIYKQINDQPTPIHAGTFAGATGEVTGPKIGTLKAGLGWLEGDSGAAQVPFEFTAEKPGTTTLRFSATISNLWIGTNEIDTGRYDKVEKEVSVKVSPCKFKVKTLGDWNVPGPAHIFMAASSDEAEVKAADAQSPFTGSTSVNWVAQAGSVGDCSGTVTIGSSRVDWTGQMDDGGQLTLNGTYQPAAGTVHISCGGASQSMSVNLTPDPIKVTIDSSGGVLNQSQVLQGPEATSGFATVVVVPEEDQTAAFNNGNTEALLSLQSPLGMIRKSIPWYDHASLALR